MGRSSPRLNVCPLLSNHETWIYIRQSPRVTHHGQYPPLAVGWGLGADGEVAMGDSFTCPGRGAQLNSQVITLEVRAGQRRSYTGIPLSEQGDTQVSEIYTWLYR